MSGCRRIPLVDAGSQRRELVTPLDWRANRLADLAAKAAVRPFSLDKYADAGLKSRKLLGKKALACLAEVTLAANNCSRVVTDGVRQKTVVVRDSIAVKKKARAKKGAADTAGGPGPKKARKEYCDKEVVKTTPRAVYCWPFFPLRKRRRRSKPKALVIKQGLKTLQRRTDACTELRRSTAGERRSLPAGYLANVLERIRTKIREKEQQKLL